MAPGCTPALGYSRVQATAAHLLTSCMIRSVTTRNTPVDQLHARVVHDHLLVSHAGELLGHLAARLRAHTCVAAG